MLTQEKLKELLHYNPDNGDLIRINNIGDSCRWKAGSVVGTKDKDGYVVSHFCGHNYKVHHLVWLYHYGIMPKMIDHINRVTGDNRIENLRLTNKRENAINSKIQKNNTSGVKGISWNKIRRKWECYIHLNRKKTNLGLFVNLSDAITARKNAELEMWEYRELL